MRYTPLIAATAAALSGPAHPLHGAIVYLSQDRSVAAHAVSGGVTDQNTLAAADLGPFDRTVSAHAFDPFTGNSGFGSASQHSTLDPLRIAASGSWSGRRDGQAGFPSGGGTSSFSVGFSVDAAVPYTFTLGGQVAGVMFHGPGGFSITQPGTYAGTLEAGRYSLGTGVTGSAGFPPSGGGFSLELAIVPAPGAAAWILVSVALGRPGRRATPPPIARIADRHARSTG